MGNVVDAKGTWAKKGCPCNLVQDFFHNLRDMKKRMKGVEGSKGKF